MMEMMRVMSEPLYQYILEREQEMLKEIEQRIKEQNDKSSNNTKR